MLKFEHFRKCTPKKCTHRLSDFCIGHCHCVFLKVADLEFVIVRQPSRGHIVRYRDDTISPVTRFNMDDLMAGRIAYEHDEVPGDSGAATTDVFGIMACLSLRGKRSGPRSVHVAIAARNVQPPHITNHEVLKVNFGIIQGFLYYDFCSYHSFCSQNISVRSSTGARELEPSPGGRGSQRPFPLGPQIAPAAAQRPLSRGLKVVTGPPKYNCI